MRNFFKRLRTAWAVFRGDYKWVSDNNPTVFFSLRFFRLRNASRVLREMDVKWMASRVIEDNMWPFILQWKSPDGCFVSYFGTEEELEELKNQEITID